MEWFFDGLGTAIITLIIGFISGGAIGYRVGITKKKKIIQKQKAKNNVSQVQIGGDYNGK
jgi:p-aminobenzoyl-glutamate transporter AbgT